MARILVSVFFLTALYLTSLYNYLLFHSLAELISIIIAGAIFVLVWNFRRFYKDSFLTFIGVAYLFFSLIDLVHTLSYKGMSVFQGFDANLPTQLWIAARYLQSISLLLSPLFLRRKVKIEWMLAGFTLVTGLIFLSIFAWDIFPVCYIEGSGLTPFKITSEYLIDVILLGALGALWWKRQQIDRRVLRWITISTVLTMAGELVFTFYVDVYGFSNLAGHILKISAYYMIYKAIIETETGAIYTDMTQLREAEKALRQSEARAYRSLAELESIYAHAPVGLCFLDTNLRYQAINDELAAINGLSAAGHKGKKIFEVLSQEINQQIEPLFRQVLATGQPVHDREIQGLGAANPGVRSCWNLSIYPVRGADGQALGVSCVVQDVTERKRAEEALRASERTLKLFIEYTPASIAMLDREMRYLAASRRYKADYRLKEVDLVGRSHYDVFPEIPERWREIHRRCLAGAVEKCDEDPFPRMDGTLDWVRWEIHPWYEADGVIGGIMLFSEVITDRKLAEIALRESEKRFRSVVDSNMIGVVFADPHTGQVTDANDEFLRIVNRKRDELEAGRLNWRAIVPSDPGQDEAQQAFRQPTGALRPPFEQELLRSDGTRVPVIIGGSYLDDEQRNMVAFVLDNTQRKRAEEELAAAHASLQLTAARLAQSNRELEQFAFVASHDLQEPLRKIQMFGSGLERHLGGAIPQEAQDYMNRMQQAADRMQTMISGLLELSRVSTRGRQFEPLNLTNVVEDVISDLEARIHRTGGQIQLEPLPSMEGDLFQIRQLFQNLIGNALKFHKPGVPPLIRISGTISRSYHASCITICVEDNGIGFDQADAERIFQPFQRLHGRNEYEGTGLGLAICQKIVERHRGRISVESRVGEGSKFSITLPVRQGDVADC